VCVLYVCMYVFASVWTRNLMAKSILP